MISAVVKRSSTRFLNGVKQNFGCLSIAKMSSKGNYETLSVAVAKPFVYHVELNRPQKLNAMNGLMWREVKKVFEDLGEDQDCRSIVLTGAGKLFCAGIDITDFMQLAPKLAEAEDVARKAKLLYPVIKLYQDCLTALELCPKPVIACTHSAVIGAGVDMITAADIRYCTKDSYFQVKEVNIGMAADVGTLQRLPKVVGSDSLVRELCYTGRKLLADEALSCGLVSRIFDNKESMLEGAIKVAEEIASQSPVAVQGTKISLVYSRDHTVQDGLDHIARWNQFMLQSEDFVNATMGQLSKQKDITFSKL